MKIRFKRLNQRGFDHVAMLVVFVVIFGLIGAYLLYNSFAASTITELSSNVGTYNAYCLSSNGGSVTVQKCTGASGQSASLVSSGSAVEIRLNGQCVYPNTAGPTSGYSRANVTTAGCASAAPWGGLWTAVAAGSNAGHTVYKFENNHADSYGPNSKAGIKYCLDLTSAAVGNSAEIYKCNGGSNQSWTYGSYTTASSTGGKTASSCSGTTAARFLCRAQQWGNTPYVYGGGIHGDDEYANWLKSGCETGGTGGTPVTTAKCGMDCSGFISVIVDDVTGGNYGWTAGDNSVLIENNGSLAKGRWHAIPQSQAIPGDIATGDAHVEFVYEVSGGKVTETYGEHQTGDVVDAKPASYFDFTAYYHWE